MKSYILGIDIGWNKLGASWIRKYKYSLYQTFFQVFRLDRKSQKMQKHKQFIEEFLYNEQADLYKLLKGAELVIFEKPFNIQGYGTQLYELLGILKYVLVLNSVPYVDVPQSTLKKFATGKGNALKSEMVKQAYKEYGIDVGTEDEVDAFFLALIGRCMKNRKDIKDNSFSGARKTSILKLKIES